MAGGGFWQLAAEELGQSDLFGRFLRRSMVAVNLSERSEVVFQVVQRGGGALELCLFEREPRVALHKRETVKPRQNGAHELYDFLFTEPVRSTRLGLPVRDPELRDPDRELVQLMYRAKLIDELVRFGIAVPMHRDKVHAMILFNRGRHEALHPILSRVDRRRASQPGPTIGQPGPGLDALRDCHIRLLLSIWLVETQEMRDFALVLELFHVIETVLQFVFASAAPDHGDELDVGRGRGMKLMAPRVVPGRLESSDKVLPTIALCTKACALFGLQHGWVLPP
mmetsp:Transcript_19451/g.32699  ORF Transcript_19451/g.32699 Transcript_19451/m.32699 type:complete len:282 (-) Transcript_19451:248-1093(-)